MQILGGQAQVLGKGTVAPAYAEGRARTAMFRDACCTLRASSANGVDLTHHAPARERSRPVFDDADELVTGHAFERVEPVDQGQVGAADPRREHAHARLFGCVARRLDVVSKTQAAVLEPQRFHRSEPFATASRVRQEFKLFL